MLGSSGKEQLSTQLIYLPIQYIFESRHTGERHPAIGSDARQAFSLAVGCLFATRLLCARLYLGVSAELSQRRRNLAAISAIQALGGGEMGGRQISYAYS